VLDCHQVGRIATEYKAEVRALVAELLPLAVAYFAHSGDDLEAVASDGSATGGSSADDSRGTCSTSRQLAAGSGVGLHVQEVRSNELVECPLGFI
jgi:hypothetical protein